MRFRFGRRRSPTLQAFVDALMRLQSNAQHPLEMNARTWVRSLDPDLAVQAELLSGAAREAGILVEPGGFLHHYLREGNFIVEDIFHHLLRSEEERREKRLSRLLFLAVLACAALSLFSLWMAQAFISAAFTTIGSAVLTYRFLGRRV